MAAKDALRSEQMAMFIPAKDLIQSRPFPGDRDYTEESDFTKRENNQQLWDRKLRESKEYPTDAYDGTLHKEIAEAGVKEPVRLMWEGRDVPTVVQGHHRIASANDIDPEMLVPAMHYSDDDAPLSYLIHGKDHYTLTDPEHEYIEPDLV